MSNLDIRYIAEMASTPPALPPQVTDFVRRAFASANDRVSQQMSQIPFTTEPTLDQMLISALAEFSAPVQLPGSGWIIHIDTHFLGGRAMWHRWEVADIGILIIFRSRNQIVRSKVALLQSKRLYANNQSQHDNLQPEYQLGFARLYASDEQFAKFVHNRKFVFDNDSVYREIVKSNKQGSQWNTLSEYEASVGIPVFYLLYNPSSVPWEVEVPLRTPLGNAWAKTAGARVVRCAEVIRACNSLAEGQSPDYGVMAEGLKVDTSGSIGYRLEDFVADRLLGCIDGHIASPKNDEALFEVFFNRSGPISAAIAITIDAPDGIDFGGRELPASD